MDKPSPAVPIAWNHSKMSLNYAQSMHHQLRLSCVGAVGKGDNWFQFAIELKWNQWQNKPRWRRQLTPASAICCCRALIDVAAAAVASEKGDNSQLENRGQPFVSLSLRIKKRPIDCWLVGIGKALRLQLLVLCVASPSGNNKIKWQTNLAAHKQQQQQQQQATSACDSITAIVAAGWEVFLCFSFDTRCL